MNVCYVILTIFSIVFMLALTQSLSDSLEFGVLVGGILVLFDSWKKRSKNNQFPIVTQSEIDVLKRKRWRVALSLILGTSCFLFLLAFLSVHFKWSQEVVSYVLPFCIGVMLWVGFKKSAQTTEHQEDLKEKIKQFEQNNSRLSDEQLPP